MTTRAEHLADAMTDDEYQVLVAMVKSFGALAMIELIEEIARQLIAGAGQIKKETD